MDTHPNCPYWTGGRSPSLDCLHCHNIIIIHFNNNKNTKKERKEINKKIMFDTWSNSQFVSQFGPIKKRSTRGEDMGTGTGTGMG